MGLGGLVGGLIGFGIAAGINVAFGITGLAGVGTGFVCTFAGIAFGDIE